jgi:hypothetical protein
MKVSSWQDNNDDILLHQRRTSVPGPNQVGGEGLKADNSSLSVLGWGGGVGGEGRSLPWISLIMALPNQIIRCPIPSSQY